MPKFQDHECTLTSEEEDVVKHFIDSGMFIGTRRQFRSICMISKSHPESSRYFKSSAACRAEEIRHLVKFYYMIHPFSQLSLFWEFCIFILYAFQFTLIPIHASLLSMENEPTLYALKFFSDMLQLADVIKLFFTGYYDHNKSKVVLQCGEVARQYAKTFFFVDIISSVYSYMYPLRNNILQPIFNTKWLMFLRFLNRLKILRMQRWLHILELWRQYMGYSSYLFKGVKVVFIFLAITFWAFSINFFVDNYVTTFVHKHEHTHGHWDVRVFETYYDATLKLLQISYGKYDLEVFIDYCAAIFFLCFGVGFQMYIYAQILQVWTKYSSAENNHHSLEKQFKEYMKYKELPLALRERMFTYFHFKFHKQFFKESDINNMVSPLLRQEILLHVTRRHIERVEFFKHVPEHILMKVVSQLRTEIFLPGDIIISAGTTGTSMFFIYHGTVAVYTPSGKEICHLEDGSHFGEIALVLSETRVATVIAVTASELFMLKRSDFFSVIEPFPEFKNQLVEVATERLRKTILQSEN